MKTKKILLFIDFIINLILGILLLTYSKGLAFFLGVPIEGSSFYPTILGAVIIGIALALLIEVLNDTEGQTSGLGLLGAITINLCGGLVLLFWLVFGNLDLPWRGVFFLWTLAVLLLLLTGIEFLNHFKKAK